MTKLERYTLYIVALTVPLFFIPNFLIEAQIQKYMLFSILMSILLVKWAFRMVTHDIELTFSLPVLGWSLFSIVCVISSFKLTGQPFFWNSFEVGIYILFTAIIAIYLSNLRIDERFVTKVCFFLMITGLIISIDGIVNYHLNYSIFTNEYMGTYMWQRPSNIKANIGNPNFISDYLALLLPIAIYFFLSIKGPMNMIKSRRMIFILLLKFLSLATSLSMLYVIFIAGSKGAYISVLISLTAEVMIFGIWWLTRGRKLKYDYSHRLKIANLIFVIAVICLIVIPAVKLTPKNWKLRANNIISSSIHSYKSRELAYKAAILQFKANPIIGALSLIHI